MTWIQAAPFVSLVLAVTLLIWVSARVGQRVGRRPTRMLFMVILARQRLNTTDDQGDEDAEATNDGAELDEPKPGQPS